MAEKRRRRGGRGFSSGREEEVRVGVQWWQRGGAGSNWERTEPATTLCRIQLQQFAPPPPLPPVPLPIYSLITSHTHTHTHMHTRALAHTHIHASSLYTHTQTSNFIVSKQDAKNIMIRLSPYFAWPPPPPPPPPPHVTTDRRVKPLIVTSLADNGIATASSFPDNRA